ncbi:MAG: multifunctional CCA addition/repair protein [Gammaproteobacteria bacterium]|nr:multifunctional CCA addition/repair protein [Gammaproteobacteria bacterium]MDD9816082.1 multifunctional CCA addition/repair protein [Gammaproteobacteria bacterium]MDD9851239.1 multifunctional CCA addition/repair protein [Gammaproteobacteria bacterium]
MTRPAAHPEKHLRRYLVGGAVRDQLLGLPVRDRDWVVVGATPQQMLSLGFKPVGRDFPVFLHPQNAEQYALARTERKSRPGHGGFVFNASSDITLDQDLARRDLTINAIAIAESGEVVDPFGGRADIERRILRHVTGAFGEDPLRVLRVARLYARYAGLGFNISAGTVQLMRGMVDSGEVDALTPARVWAELHGALGGEKPSLFFRALRECGALARVFPEVDALFGVPQPPRHHPEVDSGEHTLLALDRAAALTDDCVTRFAVLTHDLGKALTPKDQWPRHHGHELHGLKPLREMCERLCAPAVFRRTAEKVCRLHLHMHRLHELRAATVVKVLESLDAFRSPQTVARFTDACQADAQGRRGLENEPYPQREQLQALFTAAQNIDGAAVVASCKPEDPGEAIRRARTAAVRKARKAMRSKPAPG